jgi:hypothetical protein
MTTAEVEAMLRLLPEFEWEELALLMWERREAERQGHAHRGSSKLWQLAGPRGGLAGAESPRGCGAPG